MAGPFVPKLPTFNLTIAAYTLDPEAGTRSNTGGFLAQMYPPLRSSDQVGASDAYLVFPKSVALINDPSEYDHVGKDAVVFSWNGKTWGWLVEQVLPRWAGFPNEHLMALLRRMTATELDNVLTSMTVPSVNNDGPPNFNMPMTVYLKDEGTETYSVIAEFDGEFVAMAPMAEVLGPEMNFAFVPKTVTTIPLPINTTYPDVPIVTFNWNGLTWWFRIVQIQPRFANTPIEHLMANLEVMPNSDGDDVLDGAMVIDPDESTALWDETSVPADGVTEAHFRITLKNASGVPIPGRVAIPTNSSGSTINYPDLTPPYLTTDAAGEVVYAATNTVVETVTADGFGQPDVTVPGGDSIDFV